jgi:cellulase/cellobiase CelA1
VRITFAEGVTISQSWSAQMTKEGNTYVFKSYNWNGTLAPNQTSYFGILGWGTGSPTPLSISCSLQ